MISEVIKSIIQKNLDENKFTACAIGVQQQGKQPDFLSMGAVSEEKNATKIDQQSLFDLASLTKVIFTTTLLAKLVEEKKISLDVPLSKMKFAKKVVSLIKNPQYLDATFEDIMLHRAGFAPFINYSEVCKTITKDVRDYDVDVPTRLIECMTEVAPEAKLREKSIYSDLGYIFMTEMLSLDLKDSLGNLWIKYIQKPLGLDGIKHFYQLQKKDVVITTAPNMPAGSFYDPAERLWTKLCGHAGLFGNVQDVVKFGQAWLQAYTKGGGYLKKEIVHSFIDPYAGQDRRLGWDGVSENSTAGNISKNSIGHLGYTGTSLWVDLEKGIVVTLLTNRTRTQLKKVEDFVTDEQKKDFNNFRREIHNEIWRTYL